MARPRRRPAAQHLGTEASHGEIVGWAHEMTSWFALTQGRYRAVVTAAVAGREAAQHSSVHVQLLAQEAKARARMGETGLHGLLASGNAMLDAMPYPDRPDHHFKVDPAKWNYYAMDVHRIAGEDDVAERYATCDLGQRVAVARNRSKSHQAGGPSTHCQAGAQGLAFRSRPE